MKTLVKILLVVSMIIGLSSAKDLDPTLDKNVFIIFDDSGSMDGLYNSRIDRARKATQSFIQDLDPNINLGIVALNAGLVKGLSKIGNKQNYLKSKIAILNASGGTYIGDRLEYVNQVLKRQKELQAGYGEYIIVIVTDGEASDENKMYLEVEKAINQGFLIKTIGLDIKQHKLQKVTSFVSAESSNQLVQEMKKAISPEIKSVSSFEPQNF